VVESDISVTVNSKVSSVTMILFSSAVFEMVLIKSLGRQIANAGTFSTPLPPVFPFPFDKAIKLSKTSV
jgi:hypothetical protein